MDKIEYDLNVLMQCNKFNAENAVRNFPDQQAYFDKLTEFTETWHNYLHLYNPMVVVYSEEMRASFLDDMDAIRKSIAPLEIFFVASKLYALNELIQKNDAKGLEDGLRVFYAALKITSNCIAEARLPTHGTPAAEASQGGGQPLILAVDDKPELLAAISSVLRNHYKVIAVTSGNAALKAIEIHSPALFLLDIEMPGMDGCELAKTIRENSKFSNTPIIFLTSITTREHVLSAKAYGGNEYLLKPVDSSILLGKIQYHLKEAQTW